MIMFVVIKQSVFDQELSDTESVQVAGQAWLKHKNYQDWRVLAKFSLLELALLALHQQLFIREFLAKHHRQH